MLAPVVVLTGCMLLLLLGGAYGLYLRNPDLTELVTRNNNAVDYVIVGRQLARIRRSQPVSVALFGDSSCLMGIEPALLTPLLGGRSIESYCMLGTVGPAGYAMAMQHLIDGPGRPQHIVLVLHPVQFQRHPLWASWPRFVQNSLPGFKPRHRFPLPALDYVRLDWLGTTLFEPLPGAYGRYYGGERQFSAALERHHGSAIDPGGGLQQSSLRQAQQLAARPLLLCSESYSYALNDAFRTALGPLRTTVARFGAQHVWLVIAPIPAVNGDPVNAAERAAAGAEIATLLGLSPDHFVTTPAFVSSQYFSSQTHLSRWGKQVFSVALGTALAPLLR